MKTFFFILFLVLVLNLNSQTVFIKDGTDGIGKSLNGYVGIGTNNPQELLHINGSIRGNQNGAIRISTGYGYIDIGPKNNGFAHFFTDRPKFYFDKEIIINTGILGSINNEGLKFQTQSNTRLYISNNGLVGIKTLNPKATLDVNGTLCISGSSHFSFAEQGGHGVINFGNNGNGNLWFRSVPIAGNIGNFNQLMVLTNDGRLGIGTWDPGNYKLAVNGNIRAKSVEIESDWADFVFKTDYKLMPIKKLEEFIYQNGHLPNLPTEKEVSENGVNVGDIQQKLVQKIEELTLYIIELKNEIDSIKKSN